MKKPAVVLNSCNKEKQKTSSDLSNEDKRNQSTKRNVVASVQSVKRTKLASSSSSSDSDDIRATTNIKQVLVASGKGLYLLSSLYI